jgi:hypothetical protein
VKSFLLLNDPVRDVDAESTLSLACQVFFQQPTRILYEPFERAAASLV